MRLPHTAFAVFAMTNTKIQRQILKMWAREDETAAKVKAYSLFTMINKKDVGIGGCDCRVTSFLAMRLCHNSFSLGNVL